MNRLTSFIDAGNVYGDSLSSHALLNAPNGIYSIFPVVCLHRNKIKTIHAGIFSSFVGDPFSSGNFKLMLNFSV